MSMFDNVKCEFPLGHPDVQNLDFQTKDLDSWMATFKIDEKGRLWLQHIDGEYDPYTPEEIEEEKKKYPRREGEKGPAFLDFFISRGKFRETVNEWLPQDNVTDTIVFYTSIEDKAFKYPDNWVEFKATFLCGYMQSLTVLKMPEHLQSAIPLGPVAMPHVAGQLEVRYNGKTVASCEVVTPATSKDEIISALKVMIDKLENST